MTSDQSITRRTMLETLGVLGVVAGTGLPLSPPGQAAAQTPPLGGQETVQDGLKRLFGGRSLKDGSGVVTLEIPLIVANGAVVPVAVDVASPMTSANYVKVVYLVADKNRIPVITRVTLAPESGQASVAICVRLGETGAVRAIVEQSDGTLLQVTREVKVTVGGCGG